MPNPQCFRLSGHASVGEGGASNRPLKGFPGILKCKRHHLLLVDGSADRKLFKAESRKKTEADALIV